MSNAGELPRFVGLYPCSKAVKDHVLPFASISELRVAEYLAWSMDVLTIEYEPRTMSFEKTDGLPPVEFCPDFEIVLNGGEVEWVEAKYSEESLSGRQREKLELVAAHCRLRRHRYRVVYRLELEQNGFVDTISLLRPYDRLAFPESTRTRAEDALRPYGPSYLEHWVRFAREHRVAVDLLYHLLYLQRLPLQFRPLIHTELSLCRN